MSIIKTTVIVFVAIVASACAAKKDVTKLVPNQLEETVDSKRSQIIKNNEQSPKIKVDDNKVLDKMPDNWVQPFAKNVACSQSLTIDNKKLNIYVEMWLLGNIPTSVKTTLITRIGSMIALYPGSIYYNDKLINFILKNEFPVAIYKKSRNLYLICLKPAEKNHELVIYQIHNSKLRKVLKTAGIIKEKKKWILLIVGKNGLTVPVEVIQKAGASEKVEK